jgi:hypothetical protein
MCASGGRIVSTSLAGVFGLKPSTCCCVPPASRSRPEWLARQKGLTPSAPLHAHAPVRLLEQPPMDTKMARVAGGGVIPKRQGVGPPNRHPMP